MGQIHVPSEPGTGKFVEFSSLSIDHLDLGITSIIGIFWCLVPARSRFARCREETAILFFQSATASKGKVSQIQIKA